MVSDHLMEELINAMKDVDAFGSVEINDPGLCGYTNNTSLY